MGLLVRSHRRLSYLLGQARGHVWFPLIWFDVLIHVGGAPDGRLTMSKLSTDVALTTGGVTSVVDRMVEAGLVERQNCPSDRRSEHVLLTERVTPDGRSAGSHRHRRHRPSLIAPLNGDPGA